MIFIFLVFFLFVCFNSLTVHHKNLPIDFHQEVAFNQYFYLHQQFMFCVLVCLFLCLFLGVFGEQIFLKKFCG